MNAIPPTTKYKNLYKCKNQGNQNVLALYSRQQNYNHVPENHRVTIRDTYSIILKIILVFIHAYTS